MAHRSKNLLEAFQASGTVQPQPPVPKAPASPAKAPPPPAPPEKAPPAPRPPGVPAAAVPPAPTPMAPEIRRQAPLFDQLRAWRPTQAQRLIGLGGLIALAFFFLGRASVGRVEAGAAKPAEPASGSGTATEQAAGLGFAGAPAAPLSAPPPAAAEPGGGLTAAERALRDPGNKYTIKVVEYVVGNEALAGDTFRYLEGLGLPVAAVKRTNGRYYILLGAAPTTAELDGLLQRARTLDGPPPRSKPREFSDAYLETIDNVFQRRP